MNRETPALGNTIFRDKDDGIVAVRRELSSNTRTMRFVASDESVDRFGDIIRAAGWQLEHYRNNPVLLWGHNSKEPPVGTVKQIDVRGTQLMADVEFLPAGKTQRADEVWGCIEAGALRAVSVGFSPTGPVNHIVDKAGSVTGFEFTQQELLELSVVPVPANPRALAVAKSLGLSPETQRLLFLPDPRTVVQAAAAARRRSIDLIRLRAG
jgi:HK97 family phage prohead protease